MARHRAAWAERVAHLQAPPADVDTEANAASAPPLLVRSEPPARWVLTLPYPVSTNKLWITLPNRRRVLSAEGRAYKADVRAAAIRAGMREADALEGPACVVLTLHPRLPADAAARERRHGPLWHLALSCLDVANVEKATCDALNGLAWLDDRQIVENVQRRGLPVEGGALTVSIRRGMWS